MNILSLSSFFLQIKKKYNNEYMIVENRLCITLRNIREKYQVI